MNEEHGTIQITSNGPYFYQINEKDEILIICRHRVSDAEAKNWGTEQESKALATHDAIAKYIGDCLKHKDVIWKIILNAKPASTENACTSEASNAVPDTSGVT